ncbi:unnamed protein product [Allacma fusca]|uniref:Uncharacterized protein n=1 Tax=Allacma fusca TaxID=39272 RepID=A0A8J2NUC3_9HEXA|nr:unnamed protein product [Allacma fusca]
MKLVVWMTLEIIVCWCDGSTLPGMNYNDFFTDDELKSEIWKSIFQHTTIYNRYVSKVEQERKLEEIYATIKSTYRGQELFAQDALIRRLAILKFGDKCFPPKQLVVDFTGTVLNLNQTEITNQIVAYQKAILQTTYPICDYRLSLHCSPVISKCDCKVGKINEAQVGFTKIDRCELVAGQDCGADYEDGTYYYDAIENFYNWTKSKSPECTTNSTCSPEQFFFHNKCWCQPGKTCSNSMGILEREVRMIVERNEVISTNFIINIDQKCDPNFQKDLLNPSYGERTRTRDRLERLHMLSDYDITYCNLELYLNCTEDTKLCDCWKPLTFERGFCRIKNKIPCADSFGKVIKFYPNGMSIQQTGKMLQMHFQPSCIDAAQCLKSPNGLFQCACIDETKAGAFCNETKSGMMTKFFDNQRAWPFPKDDTHMDLVHEFNRNFHLLEERMSLPYDALCYTKNSKYFLRLMNFLLVHSASTTVDKNVPEFQRALSWLQILTDSEILFCNGFQGLRCLSISRRCQCLNGFHWDARSSECRINAGRSCDFHVLSTLFKFKCPLDAVCHGGTRTCECTKGLRGYRCDQATPPKSPVGEKSSKNDDDSTDRNYGKTKFKLRWFEKLAAAKKDLEDSDSKLERSTEQTADVESRYDDSMEIPMELQQDCGNKSCNNHFALARKSPWSNPSSRNVGDPIKDFDKLNTTILNSMILPYDSPCDPSYDKASYMARYFQPEFYSEQDLLEYFPLIKLHFEKSTRKDMPRCNGFEYLGCDPNTRTCKCNVTFDLIPEDGKCFIRTYDLCGDSNTLGIVVGKKREPPKCLQEDVCDRIRFNLHRCRPILIDEVYNVSATKQSYFIIMYSSSTIEARINILSTRICYCSAMNCPNGDSSTCQLRPGYIHCSPCSNSSGTCNNCSSGATCRCKCCNDCCNIIFDAELCKSQQCRVKDDTPKNINIRFSSTFKTGQNRGRNTPEPVSLRKSAKSKSKLTMRQVSKKSSTPGNSATSTARTRPSVTDKDVQESGKSGKKSRRSLGKGKGQDGNVKKGGSKTSKTKRASKSSSSNSKSSKSKSASKSRKTKGSSKTKSARANKAGKKKTRGRSKRKSGRRKPRGPPPTPVTIDTRKAQTQAFERLEKFNRFRLEQRPQEIALVHELRGYCSEPEMIIPCWEKFEFKQKKSTLPLKAASTEDLKLCFKPAEELLKECPYDEDDFKEICIAPSTWNKLYKLYEMERNRFSFFDELYAMKYVTDSMELPRFNDDVLYLIEADDSHYRSKIEYGRIVLKTKHIYTGNFVDWYFQGPGRYVWLDGGVYQGDFVNGVMHGQGTFLWPDGSIYDGQFQDGVRKGWGIYTTSKGYIFTGQWVDGVPNGNGKIWYDPVNNPENYYEGYLTQGLPDGFGTRQYANGDLYVGSWSEGSRSGRGTMLWREQKQMYRGEWAEGVPHGEGIQVWYVPLSHYKENTKKYTRFIFKGSHESGVRHGKGTLFFQDASIYEGFWSKGRQLNDGVYTDPVGEFLLSLQCIQPDDAGFVEEIFDRPTFECIFKRLVKNLSERIPIESIDPEVTEERQLTNICFKYLPELRLLYQRTVDLGAIWTNNTLGNKRTGPTNPGKNCFNGKSDWSKMHYEGLHNIFATLNELTAHELNPASKFGLWLFVRDCENTLRHATMAHYNKYWHSYPSICFQDEYSPFEVIHFWQFLQCLVVVAFEMYAGIPFDKSRIKYKCNFSTAQNVEKEEKIINSANTGCLKRRCGSKSLGNLSDDDFMDIPSAGDGAVARAPSTLLESDEQTETDEVDGIKKESSDSEISQEGIDCCPISISEIFDLFIKENLFGCFEHLAGNLLPPLPHPLPPMNDLYQGFRSIKNKGVISGIDFLYSVLPHKIHPDVMQSTVYWTRTKQIASTEVNLEELFDFTKNLQSFGTAEPEPELRISDGAGDQLRYVPEPNEESISEISHSYDEKDSLMEAQKLKVTATLQRCRINPTSEPALSSTMDSVQSEKPPPPRKSRVIEETVHDIENELLIPDENIAVSLDTYKRNFRITTTDALKNLESDDVISVLRELYPDLCGPPTETCLTFDMIFCDWLWAIVLCSNVSEAKDKTPCRTSSCGKLRLPLAITKIQEEGLQRGLCCTSNRRGHNRKFYFQEILPTFLRHESIRRGELLPTETQQNIGRTQQTALSSVDQSIL